MYESEPEQEGMGKCAAWLLVLVPQPLFIANDGQLSRLDFFTSSNWEGVLWSRWQGIGEPLVLCAFYSRSPLIFIDWFIYSFFVFLFIYISFESSMSSHILLLIYTGIPRNLQNVMPFSKTMFEKKGFAAASRAAMRSYQAKRKSLFQPQRRV